ncbi:Tunicamycin resistance protein [Klebsiella pneumoniae]|nr:Tunicamycin resistance protein [Klebsiella pneumoniae]SSK74968.1 Tunicamycin resistance protein [Klebsiella pneumoniae]
MIIWINGPFGAGKTTLAKRLRDRRSKSLIFDPEEIGFVVKETVPMPASGDYQDLPLWRGLTIAAVREIRRNYSQDIIIPMTLVHPDYLTEILDGVGVSLDIENYCTLRSFFDLSTLAGLSRRNLPEAGILLLFQM